MTNSAYKWFDEERVWKRNDNGHWIAENPPLPDWAMRSTLIPPTLFIEIWNGATAINDVQRELFWLTPEELQNHQEKISQFLIEKGYHPLQELSPRTDVLITDNQLENLLTKGLIQRSEEAEEEQEEELDAAEETPSPPPPPQEEHDYLEQYRHIQISEGGGLRFRARH